VYVESVYNYFHDFRTAVKYATINIEIAIENGRSLKLRQTRPKVDASLIYCEHDATKDGGYPACQWVARGLGVGREGGRVV
jgi:hypothetical protein